MIFVPLDCETMQTGLVITTCIMIMQYLENWGEDCSAVYLISDTTWGFEDAVRHRRWLLAVLDLPLRIGRGISVESHLKPS